MSFKPTKAAQTEISTSQDVTDLLLRIMQQNKNSLLIAKNLLDLTASNDELIIFNGRISGFFPFVDTAKRLGRKFYCFEHPDSGFGAFVIANSVVHDPYNFKSLYDFYSSKL